MDECCSICADVLEFCAFGPCGHNTVCSKCVTRLRQLQNSKECVFCKASWEYVFVTKFMDEHTRRVTPETFEDLKVRHLMPFITCCRTQAKFRYLFFHVLFGIVSC